MTNKRQELIDLFFTHAFKYEDSVRYGKTEQNKIKKFVFNFRQFGFPYIWYHLLKLRFIRFLGNMQIKLFFGGDMILPRGDIGANVLYLHSILPHKNERKLTLWILKNLKDNEIFYDIGAHMGYYTALSEKLLTDKGEIHAFEANKKLCGYLNRNFSGSKNTHISCVAIADSIGKVDFYDATYIEDSSVSSRFILSEQYITPSKVNAITIDEYIRRGNKLPTVIKLDIEGGEYDAILGAVETIKIGKPIIIMEVWGDEKGRKYSDKAVKKLQELGYEAFLIKKDGSTEEECLSDPVGFISNNAHDARANLLFLKK